MLDKSTEKTGRMVSGTLCAKMPKGINVFDEVAIQAFKSKTIISAFDTLVEEFELEYKVRPTTVQITSGDKRLLIDAFNNENQQQYDIANEMYLKGKINEEPKRVKSISSWDDNIIYKGIKLKSGCSINDGVILLQSFE